MSVTHRNHKDHFEKQSSTALVNSRLLQLLLLSNRVAESADQQSLGYITV